MKSVISDFPYLGFSAHLGSHWLLWLKGTSSSFSVASSSPPPWPGQGRQPGMTTPWKSCWPVEWRLLEGMELWHSEISYATNYYMYYNGFLEANITLYRDRESKSQRFADHNYTLPVSVTVNVVIFPGGKFRENVGRTFYMGIIFTKLLLYPSERHMGFYFCVGVICTKKTEARKMRKLPPCENIHMYSSWDMSRCWCCCWKWWLCS